MFASLTFLPRQKKKHYKAQTPLSCSFVAALYRGRAPAGLDVPGGLRAGSVRSSGAFGSEKSPNTLGTWGPSAAPARAPRRVPLPVTPEVAPAPGASPAVLDIFLLKGRVPGASSQSNCEIIMVGDFNLNWMEKCCTAADSFAMDFHLTKLISQPTRLNLKVVIIHY